MKKLEKLINYFQFLPSRLRNQFIYETTEVIIVDYPSHYMPSGQSRNWGDKLNNYLACKISEKNVIPYQGLLFNTRNRPIYRIIGSNLRKKFPSTTVIWGHGFISFSDRPSQRPLLIFAVRGPLTRNRLLEAGIYCPEVYGDPAILLPKFYNPKVKPTEQIGFIPQWRDRDTKAAKDITALEGVKVIDVFSPIESFVDEILSCSAVVSSSLHGLIAAESYGVPTAWLRLSENPLGDLFKYKDYYASFGIFDAEPAMLPAKLDALALRDLTSVKNPSVLVPRLLSSCPF